MNLYGVNKLDQQAIAKQFGNSPGERLQVDNESTAVDADDASVSARNVDDENLSATLMSWAIGVSFGRFNVRLATAEGPLPADPEPFDALPNCFPGMLTDETGQPPRITPTEYPIDCPENGILVEDRGHPLDVVAAVRAVFDVVFESDAEQWWNEVSASLVANKRDVRTWFAFDFFEQHIKSYSKSRRKAPIVWQLAVPSGRYSIWLYAHRAGRDSLLQIQNDFVIPKLAHEERQLADLLLRSDEIPSSAGRREIEDQEKFVGELRQFVEEVKRVAPLWNIALTDGVVLAMAPLWKLVPK
jgi:hypothetical protein